MNKIKTVFEPKYRHIEGLYEMSAEEKKQNKTTRVFVLQEFKFI